MAEEEVVESSSNKLCDIYAFVAKGCFPQTMNSLRKKNLKRYAQKFIIDGRFYFLKLIVIDRIYDFYRNVHVPCMFHACSSLCRLLDFV